MGVYAGLKRRHIHHGEKVSLGGYVPRPKRPAYARISSFADIDTYDERQQRHAQGLRHFTDDDNRHFISDATLTKPYSGLIQVGRAMNPTPKDADEARAQPITMVRSNRFETLPDWMGNLQSWRSDPTARQRMAQLQHLEEKRRMDVESKPSKRKLDLARLRNPTVSGQRDMEPFSSQHPYKRELKVDRTPMRDESTLPRTSLMVPQQATLPSDRAETIPPTKTCMKKRDKNSQQAANTVEYFPMPTRAYEGENRSGLLQKCKTFIANVAESILPTYRPREYETQERVRRDKPLAATADGPTMHHHMREYGHPVHNLPKTPQLAASTFVPQDMFHVNRDFREIQHPQNRDMIQSANAEMAMNGVNIDIQRPHPDTNILDKSYYKSHTQSKVADILDVTASMGHTTRPMETQNHPPQWHYAQSKVADVLDVAAWIGSTSRPVETQNHPPQWHHAQSTMAQEDLIRNEHPEVHHRQNTLKVPHTLADHAQVNTVGPVETFTEPPRQKNLLKQVMSSHPLPPILDNTNTNTRTTLPIHRGNVNLMQHHSLSLEQNVGDIVPKHEVQPHTYMLNHHAPLIAQTSTPNTVSHERIPGEYQKKTNTTHVYHSTVEPGVISLDTPHKLDRLNARDGTATKATTRARDEWMERVVPFAKHLENLSANMRDPNIFGGPR